MIATIKTLAIAGVLILTSSAMANNEPWIGRWGAPQCGPDATVMTFSKSVLDLSSFGMTCKIRGVHGKGELYTFALNCGGGSSPKASIAVHVDGDRLEIVRTRLGYEFDPPPRYRRCGG